MDATEFQTAFTHLAAFIGNYAHSVEEMQVYPNKEVNDMKKLLPSRIPEDKENFFAIFHDLEEIIVPNLTHWNHPQFYAYFPAGNAYPCVLAEILITGLGCIGHVSDACPALAQLEILACDMYGRLINLPKHLLSEESNREGGGILHNSASEAMYTSMLVARNRTLKTLARNKGGKPMDYVGKIVAYFSEEAHSCIQKDATIQQVVIRKVKTKNFEKSMMADTVRKLMEEDEKNGLIPFYVAAVFGTTGTAAIDDFSGISDLVGTRENIWFHVDAAFGGSALMLPEFSYVLPYLKHADSLNCNPYKWTLTAPDGTVLWVRNRREVSHYLGYRDRKYMSYERNFGLNLSKSSISYTRRFRALKLYFVLRVYGRKRLQEYLRNHINLAKRMEYYISKDSALELMARRHFSLVCFRMKAVGNATANQLTEELMNRLNRTGKIHLIPHEFHIYKEEGGVQRTGNDNEEEEVMMIRFVVNYEHATKKHVDYAWDLIFNEVRSLEQNPDLKKDSPTLRFIKRVDDPEDTILDIY